MNKRAQAAASEPARNTPGWCRLLIQCFEQNRRKVILPAWQAIVNRDTRRLFPRVGAQNQQQQQHWSDTLRFDVIEPPRINALANLAMATTFYDHPKFFVKPATAANEDFASWVEDALNAEWSRDYSLNESMRRAGRDEFLYGWGWTWTGVLTDYDRAAADRRRRMKEAQKLRGLVEQGLVDPSALDDVDLHMEWTPTGPQNDDRIRRDRVSTVYLDRMRVGMDPSARGIHNAKWLYHWDWWDEESVMEHPDFSLAAKRKMKFGPRSYGWEEESNRVDGDPFKYVKIFEMWLKQPDGTWDLKLFPWQETADVGDVDFLYEADAPYDFGHPYDVMRSAPADDSIYGIGSIIPVYQQIVQESELETRMYDQAMRQAEDVNIINAGVLKNEEEFAYEDIPGVGLCIRFDLPPQQSLDGVFQRIKKDPVTPEAMNLLARIGQNINDGVGISDNMRLEAMKSETSATEANNVAIAAKARGAIRQKAAEEFQARVAHKRVKASVQFYGSDIMRQLGGITAARQWRLQAFTRGDIEWGLNITVAPGSMAPPSDELRASRLMQALQLTTTPGVNPAVVAMFNQQALALDWFRAGGFPDGSKYLNHVTSEDMAEVAAIMATQGGGAKGSPPSAAGIGNAEAKGAAPKGAAA